MVSKWLPTNIDIDIHFHLHLCQEKDLESAAVAGSPKLQDG